MKKVFGLLMTASLMLGGAYVSSLSYQAPVQAAAKADIKAGKKTYLQNCATCHGRTGKADGPTGKALKPKPRNFSVGKFKYSKNDAQLVSFIKKGKGPMPAWGRVLSEKQLQNVVAYIHTLKEK